MQIDQREHRSYLDNQDHLNLTVMGTLDHQTDTQVLRAPHRITTELINHSKEKQARVTPLKVTKKLSVI